MMRYLMIVGLLGLATVPAFAHPTPDMHQGDAGQLAAKEQVRKSRCKAAWSRILALEHAGIIEPRGYTSANLAACDHDTE